MSRPFYPQEKSLRYSLDRRLGKHHSYNGAGKYVHSDLELDPKPLVILTLP
jgi:hypothetical protein